MSKKIMSIMLAIFMLASLCVVGFSSASAASVPDNSTDGNYAKAGDIIEFSMVVDLEGCWGQNGQIETYYDATKLKFLKYSNDEEKAYTFPVISATGAFMSNLTGKFGTDDKGYVGLHVNYTNATGGYDYASADGVVFRYRFEVLEDVTNLSDLIYCQVDVFKVFTVPGNPEYSDGAIGSEVDLVKEGTLSNYLVGGACGITGGSKKPSEPTIDVSALQTRIADAKALAAKTDVYTAESIAALNEAITAAEAVAANPESQDQVDAQVTALQSAMDALEKVQGPVEINTTALEALIADAKEYAEKDIYTEDSVAALKNAIAAAEAVVANPESQEKVDEQLKALQAAIDGLKKVDDTPAESTTAEDTTAAEETTTADDTTAEDTTAATTEAPEAPQTGDSATAVALMVVAIMAAGVVIFARKKAVR